MFDNQWRHGVKYVYYLRAQHCPGLRVMQKTPLYDDITILYYLASNLRFG